MDSFNYLNTAHCTSILVPNADKEKRRLAVLICGMPDSEERKLLGVQVITSSTGAKQAETTFAMGDQWHVTDHLHARVFHITTSLRIQIKCAWVIA